MISIRAAGCCCVNCCSRHEHHDRRFYLFFFKRFSALVLKICSVCLLTAICFSAVSRAAGRDCARAYTLALHDHGLLYSADTDSGIHQVSQIENMRRFQLGVVRSFRYSDAANRLVDLLGAHDQVTLAGGLDPLYAALLSNRIQGMIMDPFDYPALQAKNIRKQTTIVEFNDPATPHGLIMSNNSLLPGEREKWRAIVDAMRADGTVKRIFEKYFSTALADTMVNFQVMP